MTGVPSERKAFVDALRARHPGLRDAVLADARITAHYRGERHEFRSTLDALGQVLRLMWVADAFAAQVLYRVKAALQRRGVPILPRLAHKAAMRMAQVSIGDPVLVHPGVYIIHGQVVLDGLVEVGAGTVIAPVGDRRAARRERAGRDDRSGRLHRDGREGDRAGADRRERAGRRQRRRRQ